MLEGEVEHESSQRVDLVWPRGARIGLESPDPGDALAAWLREQMDQSSACRGFAAEAMIMMLDEKEGRPCEALRESGQKLLARAQQAGRARVDTDIDDLVRMVNAIGLATEEAPDREAQADRLFALMMDGVRPGSHG